ncbi:tryptophan-rich sensory protein [Altererythrobacter salegens]|uniref:Tryptophan-rich sensory protein n=1 Tax=Croceibacterium salegens TaxID=1737568 RepID=A0A6I4STM3_9SPHN|nr:TspO/MBR family protein [Croceibacterium salegens]MXO59321.1 tryptophan-rich sensory protein [Croceibacterium salegens]
MNRLASPAQLRASFVRWSLFIVPVIVLFGFLSGQMAGSTAQSPWFEALAKPPTFPPPALFGVVWTVLYVMMGLALALVCAAWGARVRAWAIAVFVVQFLVNLAWSPVFFAMHQITGALAVIAALDVLVVITVLLFWRVRRLAGVLLLPYLAWILFATLLNWQFLQLNPQADGAEVSGSVQRIEF